MKRIFTSLLVLCMLLASFSAINVFAADTGKIIQYVVENESTVEVTVKVKGAFDTLKYITVYSGYDNVKVTYNNDATMSGDVAWNNWTQTLSKFAAKSPYPEAIKIDIGAKSDTDRFSLTEDQEIPIATYTLTKNTAVSSADFRFAIVKGMKEFIPTFGVNAGDITLSASPQYFETVFTPYEVEENKITAAISGKGRVFIDGARIADEDVITLAEGVSAAAIKIVPDNGYEVSVATLTGEPGNIVGAAGGLHTATISGAADLTVTFTAKADLVANKPIPASATFEETKDVDGKLVEARTAFATAPTTGIEEAGLYIKKDGVEFITATRNKVGPYFKSDNTNANGQYGIEFIALEAGIYTATPYVKIGGEYVLASSSATFTVE